MDVVESMGSLVIGEEDKKTRKARLRAEKNALGLAAKSRRKLKAEEHAKEKALWAGDYVPPDGEHDAESARTYLESWVKPWRATLRPLRVLYPFLAEQGLGSEGMLIGTDAFTQAAFCFDPWTLYEKGVVTNPNIALAGVIGTGKSSIMKCLALRGMATGKRTYIPGDVKGEWASLARAVGGMVISPGGASRQRINPLDAGTRPSRDATGHAISDDEWHAMVTRDRLSLLTSLIEAMLSRPMTPLEHTAVSTALTRTVRANTTPLITQVVEQLLEPDVTDSDLPPGVDGPGTLADMGKDPGHSLLRLISGDLAGVFDGPSTVSFDAASPMISVDLSAFPTGTTTLPLLMSCTAAWMEGALRDPDSGQRFIIYDEAHRLLTEASLLDRMKDHWKLSRAWGISNVLVLHRISDLDAIGEHDSRARALAEGLLADTSTRIIYRQEKDQIPATARLLGLTSIASELVPSLQRGTGLWLVGQRQFIVNHLRTEFEQAITDTDAAMINRENQTPDMYQNQEVAS